EKVEQFTFTNEPQVRAAEQRIRDTASGVLTVAKVDKKQRRRNPAAPFTTSTLQQEASRKLGFSAQRTMTVAQRLYEGIDIVAGESTTGDIAFRATGSVLVSPGFIAVYHEGLDDAVEDEQDHILPAIVEGDRVSLKDLQSAQHFTEPPPRYSEATLVKALE